MVTGHDDEESSQDGAWDRARIPGETAEREAAARPVVALPTTPEGATAEAKAIVAQILTEWEEAGSALQTEAPALLHWLTSWGNCHHLLAYLTEHDWKCCPFPGSLHFGTSCTLQPMEAESNAEGGFT